MFTNAQIEAAKDAAATKALEMAKADGFGWLVSAEKIRTFVDPVIDAALDALRPDNPRQPLEPQ